MTPIEQAIREIQAKVHGFPKKSEEAAFLRLLLVRLCNQIERDALRAGLWAVETEDGWDFEAPPPRLDESEEVLKAYHQRQQQEKA